MKSVSQISNLFILTRATWLFTLGLQASGKLTVVPQESLVKFLSLAKDEIQTNAFRNLFFASDKSTKILSKDEVCINAYFFSPQPVSASLLSFAAAHLTGFLFVQICGNCKGLLQTIECSIGMMEVLTADDMPTVVYQEEVSFSHVVMPPFLSSHHDA